MMSFVTADVHPYSTWISLSDVHALMGVDFATVLKDSYFSFYEKHEGKPYVPSKYEIEPTFRLDILFAFIREMLYQDK